jgi:hypothetical protein
MSDVYAYDDQLPSPPVGLGRARRLDRRGRGTDARGTRGGRGRVSGFGDSGRHATPFFNTTESRGGPPPRQTALPPGRGANMVFVLPRFAITAALLASAVHAQTEPSNGAEGCRCIGLTAVSWRASYTNESSGSPVLTATVESSDYMYPVDYGFGSCEQWDLSLEPSCADADGTRLPAAPSWCERRWCWVDPASCDQRDVAETAYFPGADAHCGSHRRRHHCRRCCRRRCCRMPLRASLRPTASIYVTSC